MAAAGPSNMEVETNVNQERDTEIEKLMKILDLIIHEMGEIKKQKIYKSMFSTLMSQMSSPGF